MQKRPGKARKGPYLKKITDIFVKQANVLDILTHLKDIRIHVFVFYTKYLNLFQATMWDKISMKFLH